MLLADQPIVKDINVIGIDNIEAGRIAARRLLASGYNDVGFLGGPEKATSTRDRLEGFLDVLSDYPKIKTQYICPGIIHLRQGLMRWLQ